MSEQEPNFHEIVDQYTTEVVSNVTHRGIIPDSTETIQTADVGDQRLTVNTEHRTDGLYTDLSGEYETNRRREAVAAVNPVEDLGDVPEDIPGNEVDLGLRHSSATLMHETHDDHKTSRASVKTGAGEYVARSEYSGTRVYRPGYGEVRINNPRAQELVAKLAGKKIMEAQSAIQEVKGKEAVQDRDWHKKARRTIRRAAGKKVA